jgi:hypothetical protein
MTTATATSKNRSVDARRSRFKAALKAGIQVMGSDYDPDEDKDDMGAGTPVDAAADSADTPTPSDDPSPTDTIGTDAAQAPDLLDSVLNLLHEFGVSLPDDTTDESLINHLRVALTALLAAGGDDEPEDEMTGDDQPKVDAMPQPVAPTIATLSVQQRKALDRAAIAERALAESHKKNLEQKLGSLLRSGRCTPHEHDNQLRALNTVRMSMQDDGTFRESRVDYFVEDRETVPAGTYWTDSQRTDSLTQKLSVVEPPDSITTGGGRSHSEFAEAVRALGGDPTK